MTFIVLTQPHTHAGQAHKAGERLDVDGSTADWLIANGVARHDRQPAPEQDRHGRNGAHPRPAAGGPSDALGRDDGTAEEGAQAAIAAIRRLSQDVEIPAGLRELGAKLQDIPLLASNALKDACGLTNPRRADQRQIEEIFRSAF